MSRQILDASLDVYRESEAWSYGKSSAKVCAAEDRLRDACRSVFGAYTVTEKGAAVIAAARRVHQLDGFQFTRSPDKEPPGVHDAEAAWGAAVRDFLASEPLRP